MKKIIILTMLFCLLIIMGVYGHPGNVDTDGGHFVRSGNVCVGYHYVKGDNAGYEVIFNQYCKWIDRETLKPITPNDDKGIWTKYDKKYKVGLTKARLKDENKLCWSYYVEVDGKPINQGQSIETKGIIYNIKVIGKKDDIIVYKGSCEDQKLNENGLTEKIITCTGEDIPPIDFIFNFKTCYDIVFSDNYIPMTPTPIPSDTISPSSTPTIQPTNNNSDSLPKTGESNNMLLPILGLIILIVGVGLGIFKIKQN